MFHEPLNASIPIVAIIGTISGSIIVKNILGNDAPSIFAASFSSIGSVSTYPFTRYILTVGTPNKPIKSSVGSDCGICRKLIISNVAYIPIPPVLMNIKAVKQANITFFNGKRPLENTYPAIAEIDNAINTLASV